MAPVRVLNYGLGTNSTALAIEATRRGIIFDIIVVSDTGDERKASYDFAWEFELWLIEEGQPRLSWVKWIRQDGSFIPISELSLSRGELPSKAYGLAGCTTKWKQQPIDKFLSHHPLVLASWECGQLVERWIGYDADEPQRAVRMLEKNPQPTRTRNGKTISVPSWEWRCPLVEWGMGRDECIRVIQDAGLPLPGKSSCFMCPSMKKHEILHMARTEPGEMARALAIEDAARASGNLVSVKGLGRSFSWREFLEGHQDAAKAPEVVEKDCGCFDGESVCPTKGT